LGILSSFDGMNCFFFRSIPIFLVPYQETLFTFGPVYIRGGSRIKSFFWRNIKSERLSVFGLMKGFKVEKRKEKTKIKDNGRKIDFYLHPSFFVSSFFVSEKNPHCRRLSNSPQTLVMEKFDLLSSWNEKTAERREGRGRKKGSAEIREIEEQTF